MSTHLFVAGMSRSGTTLLATALDSHPSISMAYELLPAGLPEPRECLSLLASAIEAVGTDPRALAAHLRDNQAAALATFVRRSARSSVGPDELQVVFREYQATVSVPLHTIEGRAHISRLVAERKRLAEGTHISGFKLNSPSVREFDRVFEHARYIYILRDPRDVLASHIANDFDRSPADVARSWNNYTSKFLAFQKKNPSRATLVRYEDLVEEPKATLERLVAQVGIPFHPDMLAFADSDVSSQALQHNNAANLQRGFFTTSVGRWAGRLDLDSVSEIESACGELMREHGYRPLQLHPLTPLPDRERIKKASSFTAKRKFHRDEYARVLDVFRERGTNLTWAEAARGAEIDGETVLIVRHDIDHDPETARKMAEWEHERGIRATYCPLHTTWYYGELKSEGYRHTDLLIDTLKYIQSLGHEINLHNNFGVLGLQTGRDPIALMHREILALRSHGIDIRGTSTHGDRLCRDLDFRNYELFAESVYAERGGPRVVEHEGRRIRLGETPMAELGLEYEAYDLPRDEYITDSGGRLRYKRNTRGRGGQQRRQMARPPTYKTILGILAHPVWWDMTQEGGRALSEIVESPEGWPTDARSRQ